MIDLRLIDGESEACTVVAMRSTRSNEQPRGNAEGLEVWCNTRELVEGRGRWANEKREECGCIGNVRAIKRSSRAAQDQQRQEHGVS